MAVVRGLPDRDRDLRGHARCRCPLTADGRHDLDAMAAAVTDRTRVVLVCTPNNPTGPAVTHSEVEAFLAAVPSHVRGRARRGLPGVRARGRPARRRSPSPAPHRNVVVMRTFAKAYGLAGLRVGYLVAPEPIATAVKACSLPFGVSAVAQAAAVAALGCEDALAERVEAIVAERDAGARRPAGAGLDRPRRPGQLRLARPRRGHPGLRGRWPRRRASWSAPTAPTGSASPSASPPPTTSSSAWRRLRPEGLTRAALVTRGYGRSASVVRLANRPRPRASRAGVSVSRRSRGGRRRR